MSMKIMITGKNRKIALDIDEHLHDDRDYTLIKCAASKAALLDMSLSETPDVIIICAGDENADSVKVFDILRESVRLGAIEVIVVANEEDRKCFMANTKLDRLFFLSRPISLLALYKKLDDIEKTIRTKERELALTEFVNDRSPEEFSRKHILVVDDDPEQLMAIKENLREFYEVTVINGGKKIFKVLEKYKVDLILLDYMMPEMDGPEVLKRLRDRSEYDDIPVVFLTGMSDKEAVLKLIVELKPQGYVLKPSKKSELVAKIIEVIG